MNIYYDKISESRHKLIDRIKIWVMSQSLFWKIRTNSQKISFFAESRAYEKGSAISKVRASVRILVTLAWIGLKSLCWVALILFLLIFAENYVRTNLNLLQPLSTSDKEYNVEQLRLYAQLLTAIFSIYFATIGIILSAGYTKLRRDIIQLLTTEQVGSIFSRILVLSATFCLTATSLPLLGVDPGIFTFVIATFLTLASSLALFPLGQRLFNFFDLNLLVRSEILPSIAKHIEGAADPKNSISLANHHSTAARAFLEQVSYIDDRVMTDKEGLKDNLLALTDDYSRLLMHYLQRKHEIDQDSYWFPHQRKHQQWFFAGDTATTMALQTSSQLTPEEKPDLNWLETEVTNRLAGHIKLALAEGNFDLALTLISRLNVRISIYSREFHFEVGMNEIDRIRELLEAAFQSEKNVTDRDQQKTLTAIADTWAALGSNLCLETLRRMMTFEKELAQFFANDQWTAKSLRSLPSFLQVDIAFIVERIDFEIAVEGRRQSRPKYLQQLAVQKLLERYSKILPIVRDFQQKSVSDFANSLLKSGLPEAATQVVLASLHTYWKLPRWFEELSQLLERYHAYAHYDEIQYILPRIDIDSMAKDLAKARDRAVEMLGKPELIEHIFLSEHDEDLPDHFGQIYYELAEECILALGNNQLDKFEKLVPVFVSLALLAADSKFPDPKLEVHDEFRLRLVSTALGDLASVMGFAILYGEYFDNPKLSEVALNRFFAWVNQAEDKQKYLVRMIRLTASNIFRWSASPRDIIRTNWKMAFERRASEDGYWDRMSFERGNAHQSKVVNEFLKSHADASHLFLALRVLPLLDPLDLDLDHRVISLADRLAAEDVKVAK